MATPPPEPAPLLVFRVGHREFSLAGDRVEAVIRAPALTAIPGSPAIVAGAMNYEGTPIVAVHPDDADTGERHHAVIVHSRAYGRFAIVCDWVDRVAIESSGTAVDPDTLAAAVIAAHATGAIPLPEPLSPSSWIVPRQ